MSDDEHISVVTNVVRRIEGYAKIGLNYLQNKYDNEKRYLELLLCHY
ncbi:MAG: hypothetical protein R3Y59_07070 [bacterium]